MGPSVAFGACGVALRSRGAKGDVMKYIAILLDGSKLHGGRKYASPRAAHAAGKRAGACVVETRRADEALPGANDAEGWERRRLSRGYTGSHP